MDRALLPFDAEPHAQYVLAPRPLQIPGSLRFPHGGPARGNVCRACRVRGTASAYRGTVRGAIETRSSAADGGIPRRAAARRHGLREDPRVPRTCAPLALARETRARARPANLAYAAAFCPFFRVPGDGRPRAPFRAPG